MISDILYFGLCALMVYDMTSTFIAVRMGAKESNAFVNDKIDSEKAVNRMILLYICTIIFLIYAYKYRDDYIIHWYESGLFISYFFLYPAYFYIGFHNTKWILNKRRK